MIGATVSHYRVLAKLGEGGMGVVYQAEDLTLGRRVALKFCSRGSGDARVRENLLKEARAASSLSHPNIAHIYEYVETEGADPFIVMELISGESLRDLLGARRMAVDEAVRIASGVARALAEAHRGGIVHRDIKPANIHVNEAGVVKVLDFGIARVAAATATVAAGGATMTLEGFSGTPQYSSPEQAAGGVADARSDLFSLGVVLYECLTGNSPFAAETATASLARLMTVDPPAPSAANPDVAPHLDRVTLRLLAKDPRQRYASAEELLADLNGPASAPLERRRIIAIAAGTLLLCAAGGGAVWWWNARARGVPSDAAAPWYREGLAALNAGSYHRASRALTRATELDSSFAMGHAHLAEAWYELDYLERAKDELLRALALGGSLAAADKVHLEGIQLTITGDFKGAAAKYQALSGMVRASERNTALLDLGRAEERNQEPKKAIATFAELVRVDSQNAAAWLRLASLQMRTGARADAERSLGEAEKLFQASSNIEGTAECLFIRARAARNPGDARALINRALSAAAVTGNDQQRIKLLLVSSNSFLDAGDTAEAMAEAQRAIAIARGGGVENLVSRGLIDLGNALLVKGRTAEAHTTMQEALDIARRNRERRSEARALVNLGSLRIQTGDAEQGWRDVQSALAYYRQGSYRNEAALSLILLGRASRNKGDLAGSRRAFEETLTTMQPAGASLPLALAQEGLASLAALEDRWPDALRMFDETRRTFAAIGNAAGTVTNQQNVALMHALLGHASDGEPVDGNTLGVVHVLLARERYAEARAKARAVLDNADANDRETRRAASLALGLAMARSGDAARGLALCREAYELARSGAKPSAEADALLGAAEAALAAGDRAAASGYAVRAQAYFAAARKPESLWRACAIALRHQEARAALAQLGAVWPSADLDSYLNRPVIRRLHARVAAQ